MCRRVRLGSAQNSLLTNHKAAPSAAVPRTPDVMRRYRAKLAQGAAGLKAAVGLGDMKKKLASKSGPSLVRNSNDSEILVSFCSWFTSPDLLPLDLWDSGSWSS